MRKKRKNYTAQEKVLILKRFLVDRVAVSDLCDEYNLQPTVFYRWQKEFFENGAAAFEKDNSTQKKTVQKRIEQLEAKLQVKNEVLSELMEEHVQLKKEWGSLKASWVPHDIRDAVIDFIKRWSKRTGIAVAHFIAWLGIAPSKYYDWQSRYGKANEHNALIPRDFWLEDWEKQAIIAFYLEHPLEGYRRLTFMMLDRDIVAVSPSSVYRVLSAADVLRRWERQSLQEGDGLCAATQAP